MTISTNFVCCSYRIFRPITNVITLARPSANAATYIPMTAQCPCFIPDPRIPARPSVRPLVRRPPTRVSASFYCRVFWPTSTSYIAPLHDIVPPGHTNVGFCLQLSRELNGLGTSETFDVFLARFYAERGVCYGKSSVCDVEVSWSHRLEYFKNNSMADYSLRCSFSADPNVADLPQMDRPEIPGGIWAW